MADIVHLPVICIDHPAAPPPRAHALPAGVTDINAFRYLRERAAIERRASSSLLPDLGSPVSRCVPHLSIPNLTEPS